MALSGAVDASNRLFVVAFWSAQALSRIHAANEAALSGGNQIGDYTADRLVVGADNGYTYIQSGILSADAVNTTYTLEG